MEVAIIDVIVRREHDGRPRLKRGRIFCGSGLPTRIKFFGDDLPMRIGFAGLCAHARVEYPNLHTPGNVTAERFGNVRTCDADHFDLPTIVDRRAGRLVRKQHARLGLRRPIRADDLELNRTAENVRRSLTVLCNLDAELRAEVGYGGGGSGDSE